MIQFPNIDAVAFMIGPLPVHWYGLSYIAGIAAAGVIGERGHAALGVCFVLGGQHRDDAVQVLGVVSQRPPLTLNENRPGP